MSTYHQSLLYRQKTMIYRHTANAESGRLVTVADEGAEGIIAPVLAEIGIARSGDGVDALVTVAVVVPKDRKKSAQAR